MKITAYIFYTTVLAKFFTQIITITITIPRAKKLYESEYLRNTTGRLHRILRDKYSVIRFSCYINL